MKIKFLKSKILPFSKQILMAIAERAADAWQNSAEFAPHYGFNKFIFPDTIAYKIEEKYQEQRQIKRALRELKKRKFIETKRQGEKIFYTLTNKGLNELFLAKVKLQTEKHARSNSNCKRFCIVCFDIPVAANDVRWALKRFLKLAGFQKLQKSVWYTDQDILEETNDYIKNLKAENWIRVISASKIR